MQNSFPLWKNILVIAIFVLGALYSLPILYGDDPSVQISSQNGSKIEPGKASQIESEIKATGVAVKAFEFNDGRVLARFNNTDDQLKITDLLKDKLGDELTVAMNLAPATPSWLSSIGADPMYLGLDLRGGVHFLLEVDMDAAIKQAEERYTEDLRIALREAKIRYQSVTKDGGYIKLALKSPEDKTAVFEQLNKNFRGLKVTEPAEQDQLWLKMSEADEREIKKNAVAQNMTTLRNRVNELGVAEPVIQQQGEARIVVQLPGVQDTTHAKEILGTTATLEYRLVDEEHDAQQAVQGHVPVNSKLYYDKNKMPVLLEKRVIVTGNQIVDASSGMDQDGRPAVFITLNGAGAGKMGKLTQTSVGKRMAVVFIENKTETKLVDSQKIRTKSTSEKVISIATIQGVFSKRFQTTGLDSPQEARNLALLLRAGALAAPVDIVEERTVGPSLGQDNINKGMMSFVVGFALVVLFMLVYYKMFGLIANIALVFNVVIILAILSLLQATLTLPGIAGIVLTVGMSVDANVLIFERIREELRNGTSPQAAIFLGYEKAFATIFDSNLTTLLIAVILFAFGTGPVKGFAVTLSIGILSSMFTAITGTRMIVNWLYGNKRLEKISI
ncbi:MAG: protein translocase subunit SecD [Gammaproteobacteria bacterium]|nr:protein translocase subunit SecD [Gammaproteobacteria bacterium]